MCGCGSTIYGLIVVVQLLVQIKRLWAEIGSKSCYFDRWNREKVRDDKKDELRGGSAVYCGRLMLQSSGILQACRLTISVTLDARCRCDDGRYLLSIIIMREESSIRFSSHL